MIKKKDLSKEDSDTWDNFTNNPTDIYDKEGSEKNSKIRKERFRFDLHGYSLDDANKKVKEIILFCLSNKYKEILLITGKGLHSTSDNDCYISKELSKLKFSVPEFINNDYEIKKNLVSISEASSRDGGDGAILIKLKNL